MELIHPGMSVMGARGSRKTADLKLILSLFDDVKSVSSAKLRMKI
jgi:hypothetical protein